MTRSFYETRADQRASRFRQRQNRRSTRRSLGRIRHTIGKLRDQVEQIRDANDSPTEILRQFVYGFQRVDTDFIFREVTSDGRLHVIYAVAGNEISNYNGFEIEDIDINALDAITTSGSGTVDGGAFSGVVELLTRPGTLTQQPITAFVNRTSADTSFRAAGVSYVYARYRFNEDVLQAGETTPVLRAIVRGKPCVDPRGGPTIFTINPFVQIYDALISGRRFGGAGLRTTEVDPEPFAEAADLAEETVEANQFSEVALKGFSNIIVINKPVNTFAFGDIVRLSGTLPNGLNSFTDYHVIVTGHVVTDTIGPNIRLATTFEDAMRGNFVAFGDIFTDFTVTKTRETRFASGITYRGRLSVGVLEDLVNSAGAFFNFSDGRIGVVPPAAPTSVTTITDDDITGTVAQSTRQNRSDRATSLVGNFVSANFLFRDREYPLIGGSEFEVIDNDVNDQTLDLPAISKITVARRVASQAFARFRQESTVDFAGKLNLYGLRAGDFANFDFPETLLTDATQFQVQSRQLFLQIDLTSRDITFGLDFSLRQVESTTFDDDLSTDDIIDAARVPLTVDPRNVTPPGTPKVVESLFVTANQTGVRVKVTLTWEASVDVFFRGYIIRYKLSSDTIFISLPEQRETSAEIFDLANAEYDFQVITVNSLGIQSIPSVNNNVLIIGNSAPTVAVPNVQLQPSAATVVITWDEHPDLDVRIGGVIQIFHHPVGGVNNFQNAVRKAVVTGISESVTLPLQRGSYYLRARVPGKVPGPVTEISTDGVATVQFINNLDVSALSGVGGGVNDIISGIRTIYVTQATGNDSNDGLTRAAPKLTIQGGIDAAQAGDIILVTDTAKYRERPVIDNAPGTQALPVWLRAEIRHGPTISDVWTDADLGAIGSGSVPITILDAQVLISTDSAGPNLNSGSITPSAGTNRLLVYVVMHADDTGDVTAVTFGGQSMVEAVEATNAVVLGVRGQIFTLNEAGIAAAAGNAFAITISGSIGARYRAVALVLEDVDQTTPVVDTSNAGNVVVSPSSTDLTLDSEADGFAVGMAFSNGTAPDFTWSGLTEGLSENNDDLSYNIATSATSGTTKDISITKDNNTQPVAAAIVTFRNASTGTFWTSEGNDVYSAPHGDVWGGRHNGAFLFRYDSQADLEAASLVIDGESVNKPSYGLAFEAGSAGAAARINNWSANLEADNAPDNPNETITSANYTVETGSSRIIAVTFCMEPSGTGTTLVGITWGGQALTEGNTQVLQNDGSFGIIAGVWYLLESEIAAAGSATNPFVFEFGDASRVDDNGGLQAVFAATFENINQGSPVVEGDGTVSAANDTPTASFSLTTENDGVIVAIGGCGQQSENPTVAAPLTEVAAFDGDSGALESTSSVVGQADSDGSTETINVTYAAPTGINRSAISAVSFRTTAGADTIYIRLADNSNPNGQSIQITEVVGRNLVTFLGTTTDWIVDGFNLEGAGTFRAIDCRSTNERITMRNCRIELGRYAITATNDSIYEDNSMRVSGQYDWGLEVLNDVSNQAIPAPDALIRLYDVYANIAGGNDRYDGGFMSDGQFTGAVTGVINRRNFISEVVRGERVGSVTASEIHDNVYYRTAEKAIQFESFNLGKPANDIEFYNNRIQDCHEIPLSFDDGRAVPELTGPINIYRCVIDFTTGIWATNSVVIFNTIVVNTGEFNLYQNILESTSGSLMNVTDSDLFTLIGNVLLFGTAGLTASAITPTVARNVLTSSNGDDLDITANGGVFAGTTDADAGLNANFTLTADSPAVNLLGDPDVPAALAALPDNSFLGTLPNSRQDSGPFPSDFEPPAIWPRPFVDTINSAVPGAWTSPALGTGGTFALTEDLADVPTIKEDPEFPGITDVLTTDITFDRSNGEIRIASEGFVDLEPDVDAIINFDGIGNVRSSGFYKLATGLSFSSRTRVLHEARLVTRSISLGEFVDALDGIDDLPSFDGEFDPDQISVVMQIRTTNDVPPFDGSTVWSDFRDLDAGVTFTTGVEYGILLTSRNPNANVGISDVEIFVRNFTV